MYRKMFVLIALIVGLGMAFITTSALSQQTPDINQSSTTLPHDHLVIVSYGDADTLDPAYNYETVGNGIIQNIYDPLILLEREKSDEFVPMLATDWSISPDGGTYTFTIRQGVKFHNGNDLTPEDVAYTFQRNMLQGGTISPQWLFTEAFFGYGVYDVCDLINESTCDDRAALQVTQAANAPLVAAPCITLTNNIVADEGDWTVVFHLEQPWSPLLHTLSNSFGSIVDKEWTIAQGGWDGSCATWQDYYHVDSGSAPLREATNGTGPFKLDHWTRDVEIVLNRNDNYWRADTDPIWVHGPSGTASFATVTRTSVPTESVRTQMLLDGQADMGNFDFGALGDDIFYTYGEADGLIPHLEHMTGTLKHYRGGYSPVGVDAAFNYDINTGGPINYIGSGALDGNGITTTFFTDIHVRKAFNYAFDWTQYMNDIYGGDAIKRTGPIIHGLPGYTDTQPTYSYNPVSATLEMNQAWGGILPTTGFSLTLAYNDGHDQRQRIAELIKSGVEALDSDYHINVVGMSWNEYRQDYNNRRLPIARIGWGQDTPHPHNWVHPWTVGIFANHQSLPSSLQDQYEAKINTCIQLIGPTARTCYEDIQTTTYDDALDIFLAQPRQHTYVRAEVQGYYYNTTSREPYSYYMLSKADLPTYETIDPASQYTLEFTSTLGTIASINIPIGTFNSEVDLVITPDVAANEEPSGFKLGNLSFEILAHDPSTGEVIDNPTLNENITILLEYTDETIGLLDESTLDLLWWNGSAYVSATEGCGSIVLDPDNNTIEVELCHLSRFVLGGVVHEVHLPLVVK